MIILFDLDGTLIDSAPDIQAAANRMLAGEGLEPLDLPTITRFIGNGLPKLVERVMQARGMNGARHKALTQVVLDHYNAGASSQTRVYPGVVQTLQVLADAGHRMAICTNKPEAPARVVLADLGLAEFFPVVVGGDTLAVNKPDPAPALACVQAFGGGDAVYVGDSEVDAATAQAAGLPFYLFTEGYRKTAVSQLPHHAAFSDFLTLPGLFV